MRAYKFSFEKFGGNKNKMEVESQFMVLFDFDWSLIDENSDTFIVEALDKETYKRFPEFRKNLHWTEVMQGISLFQKIKSLNIKKLTVFSPK